MSAAATRDHLIDALEADLVGPFGRKPGEEVSAAYEALKLAPSRFYLTGFLAPKRQGVVDDEKDNDDELGAGSEDDDEGEQPQEPEPKKRRHILASSMGLSVHVPKGTRELTASVSWADYERVKDADGEYRWSRKFHAPVAVKLALAKDALAAGSDVPRSDGLRLEGHLAELDGALTVAIFLVNDRDPVMSRTGKGESPTNRDAAYAFQTQLALECAHAEGFIGRVNASDEQSKDRDERVADLQYRHEAEYAVGHGVSVRDPGNARPVKRVATTWLPTVDVPRVEAREVEGVTVKMEELAKLSSGADVERALEKLPAAYAKWLDGQRAIDPGSARRREMRDRLLEEADHACKRIREGIALLASNERVRRSFCWMNEAMAMAERIARKDATPTWRLFQLAFILLNLPPSVDPKHAERETVELIFFPTGGGKTQAYLGLIAFVLCERRVRGEGRPDAGLGVAVVLRYTLRLLTLDQLGRAATLVCALEHLRWKNPVLGAERFSIGLWVGRSATANRLKEVARQISDFQHDLTRASPFPLSQCPWCGTDILPRNFALLPSRTAPQEVVVSCDSLECPFNRGLPVLFVDEQVYREVPSFLIATVDKFALMPWRGETGLLFGRALTRDGRKVYGPCDADRRGTPLPSGLDPPELIVQDELHLISGPLGSMVGLYENVLLELAPKARIVASTATVRRAKQQVLKLYGRDLAIFPPPAVDAMETFFARVEPKQGARRYLGVAAPNRPQKAVLLRVYVAMLCAAAKAENGADPYLTLVGYFNALRELGGMRRLVEDDVHQHAAKREQRRPLDLPGKHPWFSNRAVAPPVELTSRESTGEIKAIKDRLKLEHGKPKSIDVLLASNMISVGVDIDRLGLMAISGQPKTTAEYIQASSRVGRKAERPGLVVTCLNLNRPRDRSHYERFAAFHRSFYRYVEATSVTPYSAPALDRGLAGVLVALARLSQTAHTPSAAMMQVQAFRDDAKRLMKEVATRATRDVKDEAARKEQHARLLNRAVSLLDAWQNLADRARADGTERGYSPLDQRRAPGRAMLFAHGDPGERHGGDTRFEAPLSMRDVEASVHLWLQRGSLGGRRGNA